MNLATNTVPAALPNGFTVHTCVAVACGTCDRDFGDTEDIGSLHFTTADDAATHVTDAGWWITPDAVQCPDCAGKQACAELGHAWPSWRPCGCGCHDGRPRIPSHTQPMQYRWCASCHEGEDRAA